MKIIGRLIDKGCWLIKYPLNIASYLVQFLYLDTSFSSI